MAFLKIPKRGTLISTIFEVLLKELKARSVVFNDLGPCLDADGDVALFVDKSAVAIGAALDHTTGVIGHII